MDILKGIKVVDVTAYMFMPGCGAVLAHWGADVIKVEPTRMPDPGRYMGSVGPANHTSIVFRHYNRGKRGIGLDLSTDEGRAILYKLVADADIFITSYLTDTRRKLKIDVDDIRAHNPNIIYAKGTGRGPNGPQAERGGYDLASWWGRGSLADSAAKAANVDIPPGLIGHGDGMSGHTLAGGVCAALFHRERTGYAPVVDGSLMGTAIWFNGLAINAAGAGEDNWGAFQPRETRNPIINAYRSSDGRWFQLCMLSNPDAEWADLVALLGRPELGSDPRFATNAARDTNKAAAVGALDELFGRYTYAQLLEVMPKARGVWEPVQTAAEIHNDEQTIANKFVRKVKFKDGDELSLVVPGVLFDEDSGEVKPAPEWGEHTDEILGELGYAADRIAALKAQGSIR